MNMKKELKAGTEFMPSPMVIVSTWNEDGTADAMAVAWCGVCSSNPPGIMIALRQNRNTLENIRREGAFIAHTHCADQLAQGDYFGMVSGAKEKHKISAVDYHVSPAAKVKAPVITEFPVYAECEVFQIVDMGEHAVVLGEIRGLYAEHDVLNKKGLIDLRKAGALFYDQSTNDYYHVGDKAGDSYRAGLVYMKKKLMVDGQVLIVYQ